MKRKSYDDTCLPTKRIRCTPTLKRQRDDSVELEQPSNKKVRQLNVDELLRLICASIQENIQGHQQCWIEDVASQKKSMPHWTI